MIIDRENKYSGHFKIDLLKHRLKSGKESLKEVMVRKNAVAALVLNTETNKYIFVSQWRPGPATDIIEIPAGTLDVDGEDARDAMKREIMEELGYETDSIVLIDECYMSPGGTSETIAIYYAEVSNKTSEGGGVEDEEIDIVEMDLEEVLSTRFKDAKTIIAVNWLKSK